MKNVFVAIGAFVFTSLLMSCGSNSNANKEQNADTVEVVQKITPSKYCNEKYGFCISFPEGAFKNTEENDTEEGTVLMSEDGMAKIVIHRGNLDGSIKGGVNDLKKAFDQDVKPISKRELTLNTFKSTSYILMGYEGKIIFYQKTIIVKGEIITAVFYYSDMSKDTYYPMIEPIFKSFK